MRVNPRAGKDAARLHEMLCTWAEQSDKLRTGVITKNDYDSWRDNYPKHDTALKWADITSPELGDILKD